MKAAEGRVLIDTNILIYATLENDARFARSRELLLEPSDQERFISVQNLAEMYPNLTGPKMEQPDDPSIARAKIK
jgi:predicted nucleic acid-binding protein